MSYQEDLNKPAWKLKRLSILKRDDNKCQSCFKQRSQFINLVQSFGILSFDQLLKKGYTLKKANGYDDIEFLKDNWSNPVKYIGDKNKPLELGLLKFTLKKLESEILGILKEDYHLIGFYEDIFAETVSIDLNIHHKLYIKGKKPWEYDDDALITYCKECHENTHLHNEIYVYSQSGDKLYKTEICPRCGGGGFLDHFDYCQGGLCFQCFGEGVILGAEKS
jgi:hypothetical protein